MFWLPFVVIVSVIATVLVLSYFTNRSKSRVINWGGRIGFPSILLIYIWIPIDIFTTHLWLAVWAIAGASCIVVVYRIAVFLVYKVIGRHPSGSGLLTSLTSPVVAFSVVCIAQAVVAMSVASANRHALDLALEMKDHLERTGQCLESLPSWLTADYIEEGEVAIVYGDFGTKYRIDYNCSPDNDYFFFHVRNNQDVSFSVSSKPGSDVSVSYGHYANPVELILTEGMDLGALSRKSYDHNGEKK